MCRSHGQGNAKACVAVATILSLVTDMPQIKEEVFDDSAFVITLFTVRDRLYN